MSVRPHLPDVERCDAFWARRPTDRPLLSAWVGSYEIAKNYPTGLSTLPERELCPDDVDFEAFREDYERLYDRQSRTGSDVPWAGMPVMVLPWVEAIMGCPVKYRGGNLWAEPWLERYDALDGGEVPIRADWLERLVGFTRWLVELSAGRFPVALGLMRGPADLLAAVRGASRSIYDLVDYPVEVRQALLSLTNNWVRIAHAQLDAIPPFAGGYAFSVQNLWARERGGWFQDDGVAFWSPRFYREFARPCERMLSSSMPVTGIHLHPSGLFVLDDLLEFPDLGVIEINMDDVGPRAADLIPLFGRILERKRLLIWGAFDRNDVVAMRDGLPTAGLALQVMADTTEKVQAMIEDVKEIWSRR